MNMTPHDTALDLLGRIAQDLVLHPDELVVFNDEFDGLIFVPINSGDYGRLVGAKGAIWKAFEFIADMIGRRTGENVRITLEQPLSDTRDTYPEMVIQDAWDAAKVMDLIEDIAETAFEGDVEIDYRDGQGEHYGKTVVKVQAFSDESSGFLFKLNQMLAPLFESLGKQHGRQHLIVQFSQEKPRKWKAPKGLE